MTPRWLGSLADWCGLRRLRAWVVGRFALDLIWKHVLDRRVAKGSWYYGDGATLFFLMSVLFLTGAVMTLTYSPSIDDAYASVLYISERQVLGWFVRGLHYWSAGLMTVMLFFHLFRQILVGGYKAPREATWLVGVLLFFAVLVMSFTGYVLRWDERGIYAIRVALHMFYQVPWIGEWLVVLVQGGPEINSLTLSRLYSVHIILVPFLLVSLVGYHLYLVVVHSITSPTERERPVATAEEQKRVYKSDALSEERGETFYPWTVAKSGAMAVIVGGLALTLTLVFGPQWLEPPANLVRPALVAEEWWWWWYSALIALLPPMIAPLFFVGFPLLLLLVLVSLPFIDRGPYRGIRQRPFATGVVVLCVLGLLYLTSLRFQSPWTGWPATEPPPAPEGMVLAPAAEQGRQLFARFGCNSCHPVDGHGPRVGPDLAALSRTWSQAELRQYILSPPAGVAMPAYAGRLSEEELERIVDFVLVVQTARPR